jgi:small subunit ribosomal protein S1
MSVNHSNPSSRDEFAALLEASLKGKNQFEGTVSKGIIIAIQNDMVVLDVGLKSEGKVPLKEFGYPGHTPELKVGDVVDVYVERIESRSGEAQLSVEKARREAVWEDIDQACQKGTLVNGIIVGKIRGGFVVDLQGAIAFLPGSQVDIRPLRDTTALMNVVQPFKVLKMDRLRSNIVVSRRSVIEETRAEARTELVSKLTEGQIVEGTVKNITDYGAFVDLGGVDGLLHVTDISWKRINHPSDVLKVGDKVNVQIIRFNRDTQRISLGMKQLESDPWSGIEARYPVGSHHHGRVTNIADYGVFIELEPAVEGLVYVTELSWTKKNVHPNKIVSVGQDYQVVVLDVDTSKRRISLGIKQCKANPWLDFSDKHPISSELEGTIKNITEFGLFVGVSEELDGMVHLSDLDWNRPGEEAIQDYKKGQTIRVKVLDVDPEKERISLGVKQLQDDPLHKALENVKKGDVVTCTVVEVTDKSLEVTLENGIAGTIRKADLSKERSFQKPERFAIGEKVDAQITALDHGGRRVTLSIKILEIAEQEKVMKEFGSSDAGATLGDILGAAMKKTKTPKKTKEDKAE